MIDVNLLAQNTVDEFGASPWFRFVYLPFAIAFFAWVLGLLTEMYKRKRDEKLEKTKVQVKLDAQMKELLNIERIKAVSFFASEVEKLREGIDSGFGGGCVLAWIKPYQDAQSPNADVIRRAESNVQLMNEIDQFVNRSGLLLGKDIVLFWVKYRQSLHALAGHLLTLGNEPFVSYTLSELRRQMHNDLTACLEKTVGLPAQNLANAEDRRTAYIEGYQLAVKLFKEMETKWKSAPTFTRQRLPVSPEPSESDEDEP